MTSLKNIDLRCKKCKLSLDKQLYRVVSDIKQVEYHLAVATWNETSLSSSAIYPVQMAGTRRSRIHIACTDKLIVPTVVLERFKGGGCRT